MVVIRLIRNVGYQWLCHRRRVRSVSLKRENKKGYEHDVGQLGKTLDGYPVSTKSANSATSIFTGFIAPKYDW